MHGTGDEGQEYVFLLNHSPERPATVPLAGGGTDLLTGARVSGQVTLDPLGAAVICRV